MSRRILRHDDSEEDGLAIEEKVYRRIRHALMDGVFSSGDRLSIRRVAAAWDTSPMPARSALRRLVAEQALDILPSGTAVVPRLTRKAFEDLTAMRLQLEPLAVRMATPLLPASVLKVLEKIVLRHNRGRKSGDAALIAQADREFLFSLYRAANVPMLFGFIETMWLRRSPLFWEARWVLLGHSKGFHRHDEIYSALLARRSENAAALLRQEIEETAEFLLEHLQFLGDAPLNTGLASLSLAPASSPKGGTSS